MLSAMQTGPGIGELTRWAPKVVEVKCGIEVGRIVEEMTSGLSVNPTTANDGCCA